MNPFISICIPAYKRTDYLKRLLDSITIQQYKNFEVIVSDDTPGDEVKQLCYNYKGKFDLKYNHNLPSLGTPENWNEAIRHSTGEWIKIMHDDDWFVGADSLSLFAQTIEANPLSDFLFSAFRNVYEQENNRTEDVHLGKSEEERLHENALMLFRKNYIGNPSCTLFRKKHSLFFDSRFKWVVDFEFYIRYLENSKNRFVYIDTPLVNTSLNATQVTSAVFRDASVEIPENHWLLESKGFSILRNILVYDYYWRSYRNLGIKNTEQVRNYGYKSDLHPVLKSMISWQRKFSDKLLVIGAVSKLLMFFHYQLNKNRII